MSIKASYCTASLDVYVNKTMSFTHQSMESFKIIFVHKSRRIFCLIFIITMLLKYLNAKIENSIHIEF